MLFKLKNKIKIIGIFAMNFVFSQQYFSPLIPSNNFLTNASMLAKGGEFSGLFSHSVFSKYGEAFNFEFDLTRSSYAERRSVPVIDMFDDVVTQNVYALNRPAFSSISWSLSGHVNKYLKLPISLSLSDSPYWDFRYDYSEEVRASLGPGVYNRDPVVGYHLLNIDGVIRSFKIGIASKINSWLKIGVLLDNLYEDDLFYMKGVNVFEEDNALASDTTLLKDINMSVENVSRFTFGGAVDLKRNMSIALSVTPSTEIKFLTDGLIPSIDEKTLLPSFNFSDTSSSYSITLPQEINLGFSIKVNNPTKTNITGGLIFKDWENHDIYKVYHSSTDTSTHNYRSTIGLSVGVEHLILGKTPLRFGFIYSDSPLGEEFEITKVTLGSGWVYNNMSLDVVAVFGSVDYKYGDLFPSTTQENLLLDRVDEKNTVLKATINYSF